MSQTIQFFLLGGIIFVLCFGTIYWIIKKVLKFSKKKYMPKNAILFKCLDGHLVRSKGELIIDNHLHRLGIEHEYEKTLTIRGKPLMCDWYLPGFKVYIEYWGYFGKKYMKRKEEKLQMYLKGKLNLISIENFMFQDICSTLENKLSNFIKFKEQSSSTRYCPNCGIELDGRFQKNKAKVL